MARWDIEPLGVQGVLTRVEAKAGDLGTAGTDFANALEAAGQAVGKSIVAVALSNFAQNRAPELTGVATRVKSAMTGTVTAVTAYVQGNLEMAKNAQASATSSPVPVMTAPNSCPAPPPPPMTCPAPATGGGH